MTSTQRRRVLTRNMLRRGCGFRPHFELLEIRLPPHAGYGPLVTAALADAGIHEEPIEQPADPAWLEISPEGTEPLDYFSFLDEYDHRFDHQSDHDAFDQWLLANYSPSGGGGAGPIQALGPAPTAGPDSIGQWGSVLDWPHVAVHAHLLPS